MLIPLFVLMATALTIGLASVDVHNNRLQSTFKLCSAIIAVCSILGFTVLGYLLPTSALLFTVLIGISYWYAQQLRRNNNTKNLRSMEKPTGLYWLKNSEWFGTFLTVIVGVFGLLAAAHVIPGVFNIALYESVNISTHSIPFSLNANIDKPLAGIALLMLATSRMCKNKPALAWGLSVALVPLVLLTAFLLGLKWDPKIPDITITFMLVNLFFTCIVEEVFFRGILLYSLLHRLESYRWGVAAAMVITNLLFGMVHVGGGVYFVLLASIAGLAYSFAYHWTGRLSAAVLVHFLVNMGHFFLLTYPVPA